MIATTDWKDYQLLDSGHGERLEKWGPYTFIRPDPMVIWPPARPELWNDWHGRYHRSRKGGGQWEFREKLPPQWKIRYRDLAFFIRPTNFKHTGLFPEQAANWDWFTPLLQSRAKAQGKPPSVINLFGYTGAATVAAATAGAEVCHVDAAKGMVQWCRENIALNHLQNAPTRFLVEDCFRFVQREIRRGRKYDAIIMDPPSYGRGKKGEMWKLEDQLWPFLHECRKLLSPEPLFFLLNTYTAHLSPGVMATLVRDAFGDQPGKITSGEIGLPVLHGSRLLPCGAYTRCQFAGETSTNAQIIP